MFGIEAKIKGVSEQQKAIQSKLKALQIEEKEIIEARLKANEDDMFNPSSSLVTDSAHR